MADHDDFFLGESAPVSAMNTARDTGRLSQIHSARDKLPNSARERRTTQDIIKQGSIKEIPSNQSFDSNQNELNDVIVPLKGGIRRNVMEKDIQRIEQLVFTDAIFDRHRKQPSPLIVVQKNFAVNPVAEFAMNSDHFVPCTNPTENCTETLSILPSGDVTPTLHTPVLAHSSKDHDPNVDVVYQSIIQASQALQSSEKFDTTVANLEENESTTKTCAPIRVNQTLGDNAKMIMGSCRRQLNTSSSSSVAAEPEAPSSSLVRKSTFGKVIGGGGGSTTSCQTSQPPIQSSSRGLLAFFLATTVLGSNGGRSGGSAKIVVDDTQVDRTVFIVSSHDRVVS